jgi:hypothetical protein
MPKNFRLLCCLREAAKPEVPGGREARRPKNGIKNELNRYFV